MDLYPFKSSLGGMEPVALPYHNVRIIYGSEVYYRQVRRMESIPPFQCVDAGAILAGVTNANPTEIINMRLFNNEFGQFRWYPIDHMQVTMFLPQADGKFRLKSLVVPVDEMVKERDPDLHFTEIFVWQDATPWVTCLNHTDYNLARSRIVAQGYRFRVTDEDLPPDVIQGILDWQIPCVTIQCTGFAGSGKKS